MSGKGSVAEWQAAMGTDWHHHANCIGAPDVAFFPTSSGGAVHETNAATRATIRTYCDPCPVRAECLEDALRFEAAHKGYSEGIRGGLSGPARQRLLKTSSGPKPQTGCGTPAGHSAHRRAGTPSCDPCRAAETERARKYRARQAEGMRA